MAHRWWWRVFVLPAIVATLLGGLLFALIQCEDRVVPSYGTRDFIEYWSAFHVTRAGNNPYDPREMAPVQALITGQNVTPPLMMWNPPWTLVLMAPLMSNDFCLSSLWWLGINFFFLGSSIALVREIGVRGEGTLSVTPYLVCFSLVMLAPAMRAMMIGQLGVLLLWSGLLLWFSLQNKLALLAGFSFVLLSCKPHLFVPLFLVVGAIALVERWTRFYLSVLLCGLLLVSGVWAMQRRLFEWWFAGIVDPVQGAPMISQWITSSPLNILVTESGLKGDLSVQRLLLLLPVLVGLGLLAWIERGSQRDNVDRWYPIVVGVSLLVTPFAWLFDYGLMGALTLPMVFRSFEGKRAAKYRWLVALLGLALPLAALLIFVPLGGESIPAVYFVWYAPLLFTWYFIACALLKDAAHQAA